MKNITKILMITIIAIMAACSKEGPQGPAGTNGTNGTDGNANVTVYNFDSKTTSSGIFSYPMQLSKGFVDSSLILVYYLPSNEDATSWYAAPGIGSVAMYETRTNMYQTSTSPSTYTLSIRLQQIGSASLYTSSVTFTKTRIFFIPANTFINGRTRDPRTMTYEEVCAAYNIKP